MIKEDHLKSSYIFVSLMWTKLAVWFNLGLILVWILLQFNMLNIDLFWKHRGFQSQLLTYYYHWLVIVTSNTINTIIHNIMTTFLPSCFVTQPFIRSPSDFHVNRCLTAEIKDSVLVYRLYTIRKYIIQYMTKCKSE